ncbi:MAG: GIY-YIG nuclease family protein [Saprospiraceae bacterium]|nr:GIY-YIG nuclease family protein [Saprospiraceae bacterium]
MWGLFLFYRIDYAMNYYVYIIQSQVDSSFYKGFSAQPFSRFQQHNNGEAAYTSSKIPWNPVALFSFGTKTEALIFEKKVKKYDHKRLTSLINSDKNVLNSFLSSNDNLAG